MASCGYRQGHPRSHNCLSACYRNPVHVVPDGPEGFLERVNGKTSCATCGYVGADDVSPQEAGEAGVYIGSKTSEISDAKPSIPQNGIGGVHRAPCADLALVVW